MLSELKICRLIWDENEQEDVGEWYLYLVDTRTGS